MSGSSAVIASLAVFGSVPFGSPSRSRRSSRASEGKVDLQDAPDRHGSVDTDQGPAPRTSGGRFPGTNKPQSGQTRGAATGRVATEVGFLVTARPPPPASGGSWVGHGAAGPVGLRLGSALLCHPSSFRARRPPIPGPVAAQSSSNAVRTAAASHRSYRSVDQPRSCTSRIYGPASIASQQRSAAVSLVNPGAAYRWREVRDEGFGPFVTVAIGCLNRAAASGSTYAAGGENGTDRRCPDRRCR